MNIVDHILFDKLGCVPKVGETHFLPVDHVLAHDGSMMLVERIFREQDLGPIHDPAKVFIAFDHIYPANNALTANLHSLVREFVARNGIAQFHEGKGISHQLLLESDRVNPLEVIVGGDSHTPSIGALGAMGIGLGATDIVYALLTSTVWFTRPQTCLISLEGQPQLGVEAKDLTLHLLGEHGPSTTGRIIVFRGTAGLPPDWRIVLCNMSPEMGAITAICEPDDWRASEDELFDASLRIDLAELRPQVAMPHRVNNIHQRSSVRGMRKVDVVFVGTCTGGRLSDIETLTEVIRASGGNLATRLIVCPASVAVYEQAISAGHIGYLLKAGATILPPSCGPCLGQTVGVLADGEVCVSTANRNFRGRMGNPNAEIVLASTRSAADCAVRGAL
jgi:homoaconitase/3-isopropylmalate dehydratase large subunit